MNKLFFVFEHYFAYIKRKETNYLERIKYLVTACATFEIPSSRVVIHDIATFAKWSNVPSRTS